MDGKGPSGGDPVNVGAILASADPVAMDVVACSMIGIEPMSVPTIRQAVKREMTTGRLADLNILGADPESFPWARFRPAASGGLPVPRFMLRMLGNRVLPKPAPDPSRCVGCGACVQGCPRQCIALEKGKARVNHRNCIRCYCCHEICPERAIDLI
jgi:NAD-dependent dihydropyrimidine dehydrogenase PreA subunit